MMDESLHQLAGLLILVGLSGGLFLVAGLIELTVRKVWEKFKC